MIRRRNWLLFLSFPQVILLLACAPVQEKMPEPTGIEIDGVIIRNELAFPVTEVQLLVPRSGNFVGCGNVMARSQCSTKFPSRDYYANEVIISWKEYGQQQSTGPFVIKLPDNVNPDQPATLEVIIFNRGQAGAKLVQ